jgi:hypothetical protein
MEGDPSPSDKQSAPRRAPTSNSAIEQEPPNTREVRRGEHLSLRRIRRLTNHLAAYLKNGAFSVSLIQATEVARNEQNRCTPNQTYFTPAADSYDFMMEVVQIRKDFRIFNRDQQTLQLFRSHTHESVQSRARKKNSTVAKRASKGCQKLIVSV